MGFDRSDLENLYQDGEIDRSELYADEDFDEGDDDESF